MNKKYNNIDDLFRDKFEDFEVDPPEYIWDNVRSRVGKTNGHGRKPGIPGSGISGIILLTIAIGIASFFFFSNFNGISEETPLGEQNADRSQSPVLIADNSPEPAISTLKKNSPAVSNEIPAPDKSKKDDRKERKAEKKSKIRGSNAKRNSSVIISPEFTADIQPSREAKKPLTVNAREAGLLAVTSPQQPLPVMSKPSSVLPEHGITPVEITLADQAETGPDMIRGQEAPATEEPGMKGIRSDYGADGRWVFGLYFTPEMIIYPSDDQLKNYSYSLDVNASYKFGNYFMQSGLGLARNHEQGNSFIDYNKYLGSYEDVYDVTFDSTANGIVPVYHTETVFVYDSISHVVITPSKRYFTYLQVPLFIGYGETSKRFGWFVKGGPSLSFLVHEDIPSSQLADSKARIINVENELPGRISTHWQFIVSTGVTYKLGSRLSLSMEPMFRYYINSVYEQDKLNTKHPFSVGLRTGFLLNL